MIQRKKRSDVIRARVTEEERRLAETMAAADGESLSVFIRRLIRQAAQARQNSA